MSLYRRKGSQFYWSKLYAGGYVYRFSTGARTKVEALKAEREEADRLAKKYKVEVNRSVATLAAQFVENTEANNKAPATRAKIEEHLSRQIIPFLGAHRDASSVSVRDLENYKTMRIKQVSPQTVSKELSTFRQMLRFGETLHIFPKGEAPTVRNPKVPKYSPKWRLLSPEEIGRLLTDLSKQGRKGKEALPWALLLSNTGMRSGEAAALRWEWVDLDGREIHLPAEATKTKTARSIPLNDQAVAALEMMKLTERPIGRVFRYRRHYTAWHRAVHAAGLARVENRNAKRPTTSGVRPHDLRHSFGSLLYLAGTSTPEVRDILGHATLMMANLYAHTFRDRLHAAVNATVVSVPVTVPMGGQNVPVSAPNGQPGEESKKERSPSSK